MANCIVDERRRIVKNRKVVAADLHRIYSAPTADIAEAQLDAFEEKWAGKYVSIAPAWHRA